MVIESLDLNSAKLMLPERDINGNKGTFGKVAVIAGNQEITGAALLCAKAVLKSGAGMVKVLSNEKTLEIVTFVSCADND